MLSARFPALFPALFALVPAFALPVDPPVERTLTAGDGRTVQAGIVGVTETTLELVRDEDGARFSLALDRLAEADRAFAAGLLKDAKLKQPLPDTPFLQALRKDFLRAAPDRKSLVPLAADALARAPRIVLVVDDQFSGEKPSWTQRHLQGLELEKFTVLWLPCRGDALEIGLASSSLPEGHAILSAPALAAASSRLHEAARAMMEEQSRRFPPVPDTAWYPFPDLAGENAWAETVRAKLPRYWPRIPYAPFNTRASAPPAQAYVFERDGRPTRFRGEALAGGVRSVFKALREHADELE